MTSVYEAKQLIRDAAMRRALLELLQKATKIHAEGRPEPMLDDDGVNRELKRILQYKIWRAVI